MKSSSNQINVTLALPVFLQSEQFLCEMLATPNVANNTNRLSCSQGERIVFDLLSSTPNHYPAIAPLSGLGNGLNTAEGRWLHIDPIELLVDGGNICLVGRDHLNLIESESRKFIATLNEFLQEDGLAIHYGNPFEWYLKLPQDLEISTQPLLNVIANDIRNFLPCGKNQNLWHKLLTELQMLLFDHQVNTVRQTLGKPAVNSVWLWGEGTLSHPSNIIPYTQIWTNCSLVKGVLAHSTTNTAWLPITDFAVETLTSGDYLIAYNHYYDETLLPKITTLIAETQQGNIANLNLYLGSGRHYHWPEKKSFLRKLLRK